ncbi:MAG: GumC family protein, partial [Bryobacteraceae bacterium]
VLPAVADIPRSAEAFNGAFARNWGTPVVASQPSWTREFRVSTVFRILRRHWRLSLAFALLVSVGVTVLSLLLHDAYAPIAHIEVNSPGEQALTTSDSNSGQSDFKTDYIQTQTEILQGDELASAVIKALKLETNPKFIDKKPPNIVIRKIRDSLESIGLSKKSSDQERALQIFKSNLSVQQVKSSKLVAVSFTSPDPRLAAQVTNTLANMYIELNYQKGYQTAMKAASWLSAQLEDLRKKNLAFDQALVDFQRKNGIPVDVNSQDAANPVAQEVNDLQHELTQTQIERMRGEASLKTVVPGHEDSLPQMHDSDVARQLQQRLSEARSQLADAQALFGPNHPSVKKLHDQVETWQKELDAERTRVVNQLSSTYDAARIREKLLSKSLNQSQAQMGDLNGKMIRYQAMKSQAQANEELYNQLLARLQEAGIKAGLKSTNLRIVDEARVLEKPTKPQRLLISVLGILMGIVGGIALAFVQDSRHDVIRGVDTVQELTSLPTSMIPAELHRRRMLPSKYRIGSTPEIQTGGRFFIDRPRSPEFEAVNNLYTSVVIRSETEPTKVILVASPGPKEGKTTVAVNLALALGRHRRVCLVDADLRKPSVKRAERGLRDILKGTAEIKDVLVAIPENENVMILPAGVPSSGEEMMAWSRMCEVIRDLSRRFDHVIIDSPPLIPFPDAKSLSTIADGVLLVARYGSTERKALKECFEMLEEVRATPISVVLNAVERDSPAFRYYRSPYTYA